MSGRTVRFASNALLVAASLGLGYALVAFGGPVVARATMRPYPGREKFGWQKPTVAPLVPADALAELERLEVGDSRSIERASELVAAAIAHYWPAPGERDRAVECRFLEHPDFWFRLWWLERTGADQAQLAHLRRREREDWRSAILLGVGYCSQQAMILERYLRERGIESKSMGLGGHVVTVATTPDGEWILDPDYGAVIRRPLEEVTRDPELVRAVYESAGVPPKRVEELVVIYGPEKNARYHGNGIGRIEHAGERARHGALWGGLAALAGGLWLRRLSRKPQQASREAALHHDAA